MHILTLHQSEDRTNVTMASSAAMFRRGVPWRNIRTKGFSCLQTNSTEGPGESLVTIPRRNSSAHFRIRFSRPGGCGTLASVRSHRLQPEARVSVYALYYTEVSILHLQFTTKNSILHTTRRERGFADHLCRPQPEGAHLINTKRQKRVAGCGPPRLPGPLRGAGPGHTLQLRRVFDRRQAGLPSGRRRCPG